MIPDFTQPDAEALTEWTDTRGRLWVRKGKVWHTLLATRWHPSKTSPWELELLEDLFVVLGRQHWVIPRGFRFDGASVMYKLAHLIYDRYGRREAIVSAVHDWLYSNGQHEIPASIVGPAARRAYADYIFDLLNDAMSDSPREELRGKIAMRFVRWLGGFVYKPNPTPAPGSEAKR